MPSTFMASRLAEEMPGGRTDLVTPLGVLQLVHDADGALWSALFADGPVGETVAQFSLHGVEGPEPVHGGLLGAFRRYFAGDLHALDTLETLPRGTDFERAVWAELRRIPPGETRSYSDIARALGGAASGPGANARAVGTANARNPVAIVVPCHRVIGADGSLTGYAGGLERKRWLLEHEGWRPQQAGLF